ncbi:hypothetical protein ACFOLJ_29610 [Rugamonas sp. CCM 8940]|uniref:hypothetical protein n=1 Tax=Rugamonas sp. CCM 8940 TaxID=2765359 RepID=UPI0018F6D61E|nr:hypothetical protein [Rugamonas sp. CCM 8940]MBJ7312987.1 hypothetical protein [Rugamonas sp. CCM 8940]
MPRTQITVGVGDAIEHSAGLAAHAEPGLMALAVGAEASEGPWWATLKSPLKLAPASSDTA